MDHHAPKPNPGLHSTVLKAAALHPSPALASAEPGFRELAKVHARAAANLAEDADEAHAAGDPDWADLLDLAQVHAMVSQACSSVAPVARQRLIPCTKDAK